MKRLPSLKQLQYLIALHHNQHFGRAAEAVFISQSTLSAAISQLEETLGAQLLERDHKAFLFTPLGEEIVRRGRQVVAEAAALAEYAQTQGRPLEGDFYLGCIPTIAPFIVSELLEAVALHFPKLTVYLREDTTDMILAKVANGQLDMAILSLPYPTPGLVTHILARDPFHLILPKDWADTAFLRELTFWPDSSILLLEKEHCLTRDALSACQIKDHKKIHPFHASSLHTLVQMVNKGIGMTFLPQLAINSGILQGTQLSVKAINNQPNAYREIGVAWRPTSKKLDSYALFTNLITEVLAHKIDLKAS